MGLRVDIPGLDRVAREVPDGALVVLEGGADPGKERMLQALARRSATDGRRPHLFLSKPPLAPDEAPDLPSTVIDGLGGLKDHDGDVFVDSFSMLGLGATPRALVDALQALRLACLRHRGVAVVTIAHGMLDASATSVVRYLADGLVRFLEREDDDGVSRYLQIPRWPGGADAPRNVYYEVHEGRLLVDTRDRVS